MKLLVRIEVSLSDMFISDMFILFNKKTIIRAKLLI
jgi:hypothetical protein